MRLSSRLTEIKGVGEKTAATYAKAGLVTARDVLEYWPRDYDFYEAPVSTAEAIPGRIQTLRLTITGRGVTLHGGSRKLTQFHAADATGNIRIAYFNMPYMINALHPGTTHIFRGMIRTFGKNQKSLDQPQSFSEEDYRQMQNTWQPVYHLTKGMKNAQIIKLVRKVLDEITLPEDYIPEEDRQRMELIDQQKALRLIHFPVSREDIQTSRSRLVFDEFFEFLIAIRRQKNEQKLFKNERPMLETADTVRLLEQLPYELTPSQKRAWEEIKKDLTGPHVMNRLLQGDVGSGKTILAFLALIMCACNGRQGALMAPTEVLAAQHMENLVQMIHDYHLPLHPVLLTGSMTAANKRRVYSSIESGEADVVIGTHALIQEKVQYHDLGLVITDEQHRFGVRQREALSGKGKSVPVLVMSATPIPRTLSIILYGDLQVSRLTDMPSDRLRVKNLVIDDSQRGRIYRFILDQIREGRQAYVICPAVEENEALDNVQNVTDYTAMLQRSLPEEISIASLNGRMKSSEKQRVMQEFADHHVDILVSTTVIEVGINVPNASVILIENAERFGLSQLHQLRGRVGRGRWQSYCIFMYSSAIQNKPKRLEILEKSNDGFYIAEQDLKLRGPGDLFGVRQSGEMGFHLADIYEDADELTKAASYADEVLAKNPDFQTPFRKEIDFRSI